MKWWSWRMQTLSLLFKRSRKDTQSWWLESCALYHTISRLAWVAYHMTWGFIAHLQHVHSQASWKVSTSHRYDNTVFTYTQESCSSLCAWPWWGWSTTTGAESKHLAILATHSHLQLASSKSCKHSGRSSFASCKDPPLKYPAVKWSSIHGLFTEIKAYEISKLFVRYLPYHAQPVLHILWNVHIRSVAGIDGAHDHVVVEKKQAWENSPIFESERRAYKIGQCQAQLQTSNLCGLPHRKHITTESGRTEHHKSQCRKDAEISSSWDLRSLPIVWETVMPLSCVWGSEYFLTSLISLEVKIYPPGLAFTAPEQIELTVYCKYMVQTSDIVLSILPMFPASVQVSYVVILFKTR